MGRNGRKSRKLRKQVNHIYKSASSDMEKTQIFIPKNRNYNFITDVKKPVRKFIEPVKEDLEFVILDCYDDPSIGKSSWIFWW
jgi:hypothetical protein